MELTTEICVHVTFRGQKRPITCSLSGTLESVARHVLKHPGYFVYDDQGCVLLHNYTLGSLRPLESTHSPFSVHVKDAVFKIQGTKIDLTKYETMKDFMTSSCLCEVWYNNQLVDLKRKNG